MNESEWPEEDSGPAEKSPRDDGDSNDDFEDTGPGDRSRSETQPEHNPPPHNPAPDGWSTEVQLDRWKAGDEGGFNELYQRFKQLLALRVRGHRVWPLLAGRHQVEDLVQEVWGEVAKDVRRSFTSRGPGSFLKYLAALVEHRLIDQARKDTAEKRGDGVRAEDLDEVLRGRDDVQSQPGAVETPTSHARLKEMQTDIQKKLTARELEAWELRQQGHSFAEIGFATRSSENAARGLHDRARHKLIEGFSRGETD